MGENPLKVLSELMFAVLESKWYGKVAGWDFRLCEGRTADDHDRGFIATVQLTVISAITQQYLGAQDKGQSTELVLAKEEP